MNRLFYIDLLLKKCINYLVPAGHAALVDTVNSVVVVVDPVEIVDFVVPVEIVVAAVPETAAVVVPGIVGAVALGIADRPGGQLEGHEREHYLEEAHRVDMPHVVLLFAHRSIEL